MRTVLRTAAWLLICAATSSFATPPIPANAPRLVVQITVDQLRGDMPRRLAGRPGESGFRTLTDNGATFVAAHYQHGITETAPGHATLFTGANPREHGIIGNEWFDPESGTKVYNTVDTAEGAPGGEPSPSGRSPRNLLGSTIGDELIVASGFRSRVFAISVKDRGAILPAGNLGKAFWYQGSTGRFVTGSYYYPEAEDVPGWLTAWNERDVAGQWRGRSWELMEPRESYRFGALDDRECERSYKHLGRTFPHALDAERDADFYAALRYTPVGDELVLSLAREVLVAEELGQRESTDFLALSFSSTDYVGHAFGPASLEAEDNLRRLDATLAVLFAEIDRLVGLENTLIALCADHGAATSPEHLASKGAHLGWVDSIGMVKATNEALSERFGTERDLVWGHVAPYLWLHRGAIQELGLDLDGVARVAGEVVQATEGMAHGIPRSRIASGALPDGELFERVAASFHEERSGDVYLVPEPGWLLGSGNAAAVLTSMHGSPWSYDTHVPILMAGPGVRKGTYADPAAPRDIAPTLAELLGTASPSAATGRVLAEAL